MRTRLLVALCGLVAVGLLAAIVLGDSGGSGTHRAASTVAATATATVKAAAPPAHRALKMIWGPNTLPQGGSAFPVYRRLGVDVLQAQLGWARVALRRPADPRNPADPAYAWPADLDQTVREAAAAHIQVALMVKETPDWANGGRGIAQAPDRDADYADFLVAASRRYPSVHHWMIWGEPTRPGNFSPMPENRRTGPRRYARLLDAAYGALKGASPENVVIGGMTWTLGLVTPPDFIRWLRLPDGAPPRMDLWGHNPYATRFPRLSDAPYYPGLRDLSDVDTLHEEIARAYAGRHVPGLWLSEFSVASDRDNRGFQYHVSRAEQARWLTAAYAIANAAPYVAGLGWYDLADQPKSIRNGLTNGLLTRDGRQKPAFAAYAAVR